METAFFCTIKKEVIQHDKSDKKGKTIPGKGIGHWSAPLQQLLISLQPIMADTIWDRFSKIMRDVYGQLAGISTIVAVTAAAVALLVRMISRNQRAVDEATSWLKRIVVTWIVSEQFRLYSLPTCSRLSVADNTQALNPSKPNNQCCGLEVMRYIRLDF